MSISNFNYDKELNNYNSKIDFIRRMVSGLARNNIRGLIISGAPGIGKSYNIIDTLDSLKNPFNLNISISKGHITPFQLYKTLSKNKDENCIHLFDDCDAVLDNTQSLNLLKAATEFTKKRTISWNSSINATAGVDEDIEFKGKIIILTNKTLNNNPHYKALIDRIHYYDMKVSFNEKLAKIISMSQHVGNLINPNTDYVDVIEYLLVNQHEINKDKFSLRDFIKLAEMKSLFGTEWINYLDVMNSRLD
jgi:hypothetical protein